MKKETMIFKDGRFFQNCADTPQSGVKASDLF